MFKRKKDPHFKNELFTFILSVLRLAGSFIIVGLAIGVIFIFLEHWFTKDALKTASMIKEFTNLLKKTMYDFGSFSRELIMGLAGYGIYREGQKKSELYKKHNAEEEEKEEKKN
jgi:hypothetical protein